jgi:glycosyltransferase involved in cell wall biosynthesis
VVVFPSIVAADGDREGFGLVLVEALACECAVVATDLPATRDIVKDMETALIIRQKDASQISDKVIQLFDDSKLRKSLGTTGRRHVLDRFDWHTITKRYTELIDCVIGKRISCGHPAQ